MKDSIVWAVEDSVEMRKTLRDIFTRLGCDVTLFGTAETALAKLQAGFRPDVLILDFRLPGMSGPQLFRKMGMDEKMKTVPVVPFTSHWEEDAPSPLALEWDNLALALTNADPADTGVIKKLEGDDFTIPERLIPPSPTSSKAPPKDSPNPMKPQS